MQDCFTYVNALHFTVFCFYFGLACSIAAGGFRNNSLRVMVFILLLLFSAGSIGKFLQHMPCTSYDFFIKVYYATQLQWILIAPLGALIALKIAGLGKKKLPLPDSGIWFLRRHDLHSRHSRFDRQVSTYGFRLANNQCRDFLEYALSAR